jgi:DNA-binding MarR family transcriptional regulator
VKKDDALAASTWVRLLKVHGLVLRQMRRRVPAGLTLPQLDVLAQLARHGDGMTAGDLTRELLVTAGNVTGIVDRLVALRLVERRRVPEDRRTARITLTASGRRLASRALPRHRKDVADVLAAVPEPRLRELRQLLGEACTALQGGDA